MWSCEQCWGGKWQLGSVFLCSLLFIYFAFYSFYPVSPSSVSPPMPRYDYKDKSPWFVYVFWLIVIDSSWCLIPVVMPHVWRSCTEPQCCLEVLPVWRQDWGSVLFSGWRGEHSGVNKQLGNFSLIIWLENLQIYLRCIILSDWIYLTALWVKWRISR